jgi:hypothetical protein
MGLMSPAERLPGTLDSDPCGPERGRWKCRSPGSDPARVFKARCRAGGAPSRAEDGGTDPPRPGRSPGFEPGTASMAVSSSKFGSPARCEQAGDGRGRRNRIPRCYPPPGFRPGPAAWLVHPPRKVEQSKPTVSPAHPLATELGALADSPSKLIGQGQAHHPERAFRVDVISPPPPCPTRDSNSERHPPDGCGSTKVGLEGHASDRPDSNRPSELGELEC